VFIKIGNESTECRGFDKEECPHLRGGGKKNDDEGKCGDTFGCDKRGFVGMIGKS
jgi:hypothetical protein